jgi:hypothetical protein
MVAPGAPSPKLQAHQRQNRQGDGDQINLHNHQFALPADGQLPYP